jgi:SAM-dependent methyltransferase
MSKEKFTTQDLQAEKAWHDDERFYIDSGHWTSNRLFVSRERHWLSCDVEKIRFYGYLAKYISKKPYYYKADILIAPIGSGYEVEYLQGLYSKIYGIDISGKALAQCPAHVVKEEGDILQSKYLDDSFDIIICPLFLHHVHKIGFKPFLEKYYSLLREGGVLAIQEPSAFFLPSKISSFLRIFMGNVTGLVVDERPICPTLLTRDLKVVGFKKIRYRGLSFNHVRYPMLLQIITLLLDWPWRVLWPFKLFCNGIGWYCEKKIGVGVD